MSANQMNPIEPKLEGITCSDDYSQARRHGLCSKMEVRSFQFSAIHFEPSNCCLELGELRCRMLFSRVVQLLGAEVAELGRLGTWRCRIPCHLETLQPAHHHPIYQSTIACQPYRGIYLSILINHGQLLRQAIRRKLRRRRSHSRLNTCIDQEQDISKGAARWPDTRIELRRHQRFITQRSSRQSSRGAYPRIHHGAREAQVAEA